MEHRPRVHIAGLSRAAVQRKDAGQPYEEEKALADFFRMAGCNVTEVSLLVDNRSKRSRGFAFVEFLDDLSFRRACQLNGLEKPIGVKLDERAGGRLQVSPAKPAPASRPSKEDELIVERTRTEDLERTLRRVTTAVDEILAKKNKNEADLEAAVQEEQRRQQLLLCKMETMAQDLWLEVYRNRVSCENVLEDSEPKLVQDTISLRDSFHSNGSSQHSGSSGHLPVDAVPPPGLGGLPVSIVNMNTGFERDTPSLGLSMNARFEHEAPPLGLGMKVTRPMSIPTVCW